MKRAVKLAARQPTAKNISEAYRRVDRAAKKGIVHKNTAARLKARLAKRLKEIKVSKVSKVIKKKTATKKLKKA